MRRAEVVESQVHKKVIASGLDPPDLPEHGGSVASGRPGKLPQGVTGFDVAQVEAGRVGNPFGQGTSRLGKSVSRHVDLGEPCRQVEPAT
jgi:hypothetical protein